MATCMWGIYQRFERNKEFRGSIDNKQCMSKVKICKASSCLCIDLSWSKMKPGACVYQRRGRLKIICDDNLSKLKLYSTIWYSDSLLEIENMILYILNSHQFFEERNVLLLVVGLKKGAFQIFSDQKQQSDRSLCVSDNSP
jgi:hypothetical protein